MIYSKRETDPSPFVSIENITRILKTALPCAALIVVLCSTLVFGQTLISGDIDGRVTDPSGAVIADATVIATEIDTGTVTTAKTTGDGVYHLPLLKPGRYTMSVSSPGFNNATVNVLVALGKVARANVKMVVGSTAETVDVTEAAPLLDTENGQVTTTFSLNQVQDLPNPGNDITYVAQLAPGSVMNTAGGSGNYSSFGLPSVANNLTVNGVSQISPYSNTNNTYAVNTLLGNNDISQVTVVSNAYSAEYGALAGAQETELTRSGSNQFHGNAAFWYNDRNLNANNYFNNQQAIPRSAEQAKQWAAAIGGPIIKNNTFFFINTEGLRFTAPPATSLVHVPSPSFEARVLSQISAQNPAELNLYKQIFNLYNNAPIPAGQTLRPYQNVNPITGAVSPNPDVNVFTFSPHITASEQLVSGRIDHNFSGSDTAYAYVKKDWGVQPTYEDPINSAFNVVSTQPFWTGDLVETHTFSPSSTNQFLFNIGYAQQFYNYTNPTAAYAAFPYQLRFQDTTVVQNGNVLHYADSLYQLNNQTGGVPQGYNQTQYQFTDNYNKIAGTQTFSAGFTFLRFDITQFSLLAGTAPQLTALGEGYSQAYEQARGTGTYYNTFANGYARTTHASFPALTEEPLSQYQLGGYVEDQWQARPNLTLNAGIRIERNSNPACNANCNSHFAGNFFDVHQTPNTPYNSVIDAHQRETFANYQAYAIEPRASFAWQPYGADSKMVVRGGFGIFTDPIAGNFTNTLLYNIPDKNGLTANSQSLSVPNSPQYLLDPALAGSGYSALQASNAALVNGFNSGGTYATISQAVAAAGSHFSLPGFTNARQHMYYPTYEEWNLQIQQQIGNSTTISLGYNGNHGYHEPIDNNSVDAWWNPNLLPVPGEVTNTQTGNVFHFQPQGFPTSAPNQQFSSFSEYFSGGVSNYNGLTVDVTHRTSYLSLDANYSWGHALDEISNEGIFTFGGASSYSPQSPYNLRYDYGNADYDVRNNFKLSYVLDVPQFHGLKRLTGGWQLTQALFWHSGFPFTVTDGFVNSGFGAMASSNPSYPYNNYNGAAPAVPLNRGMNRHCGTVGIFNFATQTGGQCFGGISAFTDPSGLGADGRNQYTGPGYFDTDVDVLKTIAVPHTETAKFQFGVQMFNALNHPNFGQPNSDISAGSSFGQITSTVSGPTSIYGAYLGGDASPRLIQLKGTLIF